MSSKTEICNLALSHLGVADPIANIETEKTAEATACRTFYDITRQHILRDHPWPFCRRFVQLGLVEECPNDEWGYSYRYPSEALYIRKILGGKRNQAMKEKQKYIIANDDIGKLIWADLNPATAEIIIDEQDATLYDPIVTMAFSYLLAFHIAPRVQDGDPADLATRALRLYNAEITKAKAMSFNEESKDRVPESEFIRDRDGLENLNERDSFRTGI